MIDRRNLQAFHPFARLNRLLDGVAPGPSKIAVEGQETNAPVLLQLGEPRNQPPAFVADVLTEAAAGWSSYPPPRGTADYRQACVDWLIGRYALPAGMIDPETMILPLPGTREGLFFAALANTPRNGVNGPERAPERAAVTLMPNPFYHVYAGASAAAGAAPVFVSATQANGFLPDYGALPAEVLERASLCYFCSPSNPQGAAASLEELQALIQLARKHDFTIAFDECYAEIYTAAPPAGALQAAAALGGSLDNMLVFHSLSKRSSAPGLRCGFVAGDAARITDLDGILRVGGAGVSLPVRKSVV